jgi:hypothetical protein
LLRCECRLLADFVAEVGDRCILARDRLVFRLPIADRSIWSDGFDALAPTPTRLRRARGDGWWWSDDQLGEPAQVLRDGCKGELVLCTARPRNRRRPSFRMRFKCANSISTRFLSQHD